MARRRSALNDDESILWHVVHIWDIERRLGWGSYRWRILADRVGLPASVVADIGSGAYRAWYDKTGRN